MKLAGCRLCKFSPIGRLFTLGIFFLNYRSSLKIWAMYNFPQIKLWIWIDKNWPFFSQTHLVTLEARHLHNFLHTFFGLSFIIHFSCPKVCLSTKSLLTSWNVYVRFFTDRKGRVATGEILLWKCVRLCVFATVTKYCMVTSVLPWH
jgi:hypothetical protein